MSPNPSNSSSDYSSPNLGSSNGLLSPANSSTPSKPKRKREPRKKPRIMKATVKPVFKAATVAKKGYIYLMQNGEDAEGAPVSEWKKLYAILRRPYLSLYKSSSEQEELPNVINISTVRVDHSAELEEVLSVSSPSQAISTVADASLIRSDRMLSEYTRQYPLCSWLHQRSPRCWPGLISSIPPGAAISSPVLFNLVYRIASIASSGRYYSILIQFSSLHISLFVASRCRMSSRW